MANLNKVIGHLSASEWSQLLTAWAEEFQHVPEKQTLTYQVKTASPSLSLARQKCYQSLQPNFIKQALYIHYFDYEIVFNSGSTCELVLFVLNELCVLSPVALPQNPQISFYYRNL